MSRNAKLAPSLVVLRDEIDELFPKRDKGSDGWIGDPAHASRPSDHNPNSRGVVDALDIDVDDNDPKRDLRTLVIEAAKKHPSTNYIISNGLIYKRRNGFRPEKYTRPNGHFSHVHVSILQTKTAEQSTRRWNVATGGRGAYPILRYGTTGPRVLAYTKALRKAGYKTTDTDRYQSPTVAATERLQKAKRWRVDGVAYYKEQHELGLPTP